MNAKSDLSPAIRRIVRRMHDLTQQLEEEESAAGSDRIVNELAQVEQELSRDEISKFDGHSVQVAMLVQTSPSVGHDAGQRYRRDTIIEVCHVGCWLIHMR